MSEAEIDGYLAGLEEPKRSTLVVLRRTILDVVPDAEQCIAYGMPAFRLHGKVIAGFAAFTHHLSYLPHSGSVLSQLPDDLAGYVTTEGSLHFAVDTPLPRALVEKLIAVRLREVAERAGRRRAPAAG
ncbi:MAG: iron chaperone [Candidatus Dormibacteria bacterium]